MGFIYVMSNNDWDHEGKKKYGFTNTPERRLSDSHEQHSYLSSYCALYEISETLDYRIGLQHYDTVFSIISTDERKIQIVEDIYNCRLPLLRQLSDYLVKDGGSTEFIYSAGMDLFHRIIIEELPMIGLQVQKEYTKEELVEINNAYVNFTKEQNRDKQLQIYKQVLQKSQEMREKKGKQYRWSGRNYQNEIILLGAKLLRDTNKLYLELATGGGKSFIVYNLLSQLDANMILILSPRKIINVQNPKTPKPHKEHKHLSNKYQKISK